MLNITPEIQKLIDGGALFVINDSGGKDSQIMRIEMSKAVPADQLVIVHAHLPEVEWDGTIQQIERYAGTVPVHIVQAGKTLLGMVAARGMWPSPESRQCTSDLKRGPITKRIKAIMKKRDHPVIVNCVGLRAEESSSRAKQEVWRFNAGETIPQRVRKDGKVWQKERIWFDWLPIHHLKTWQVFQGIEAAGEEPHWVYAEGMTRASCCLCIMSSVGDLRTAARLRPDLYQTYVRLERTVGQSMRMPVKGVPQWLDNVVGIPVPA